MDRALPARVARPFPGLTIRLMAPVLALTYMCPLNILGSLVFFTLLGALKLGLMQRVGVRVGLSGQEIGGGGILHPLQQSPCAA